MNGNLLKKRREELRLTVAELSKELGISINTIKYRERSIEPKSIESLRVICKRLNLDIAEVLESNIVEENKQLKEKVRALNLVLEDRLGE